MQDNSQSKIQDINEGLIIDDYDTKITTLAQLSSSLASDISITLGSIIDDLKKVHDHGGCFDTITEL